LVQTNNQVNVEYFCLHPVWHKVSVSSKPDSSVKYELPFLWYCVPFSSNNIRSVTSTLSLFKVPVMDVCTLSRWKEVVWLIK